MKLRINKWLGYSIAALTLLGVMAPAVHVSARQTATHSAYRVAQYHYPEKEQTGISIKKAASIPNQGYTNYVTGNHALYTLPGTVPGARRLLTKSSVRKLANRQVPFMAYQYAITNRGLRYFKIVSLHHSVRGWIYETDLRSILNRSQQKASINVGKQIDSAEIKADESKHRSIVNQSSINLKAAQKSLRQAQVTVKALKGTPDYQNSLNSIKQGYYYLQQVKTVMPSIKTMLGIEAIRADYQKAAKSVTAARIASANHQNKTARKNIKAANRSLRHVSGILSQIHNNRDRRTAMKLFNQALSYTDNNYGFTPAGNLSGQNGNGQKVSNKNVVKLIDNYEQDAQKSLMDLYPHLDNFDVALTDAYRAQNDLNQAHDLVASLQGTHLQKAELKDIQASQHNINALWNV